MDIDEHVLRADPRPRGGNAPLSQYVDAYSVDQ